MYDDTARGGVIACPRAVLVRDRNGTLLASRNPWTDCAPNALNTILFSAAGNDSSNATIPGTGVTAETNLLSITLINALYYSVALSEVQIWVPSSPGPRYEVEDGLLGTFIGGFEGKKPGLNYTIENAGVLFGSGGWVEVANVKNPGGGAGVANLTVIGSGSGTLAVQTNFLSNERWFLMAQMQTRQLRWSFWKVGMWLRCSRSRESRGWMRLSLGEEGRSRRGFEATNELHRG